MSVSTSGADDLTRVGVQRLEHGRGLSLPSLASEGSAGYDLKAAVSEPLSLDPGERVMIPTGLVLEIPSGWEGQVRPRSGLASRHGVTLVNTPGTIDSDYRGEVKILLINLGQERFTVERGDRIAQIIFAPVARLELEERMALGETDRSTGGFGSTGISD